MLGTGRLKESRHRWFFANFVSIKGPELHSVYFGEFEGSVRESPDITDGVDVGNDDLDDETHSMTRENDDLLWLRPDDKTQVQTIPKRVRGIQLQPREQVVEVLIVLHFEQLVGNP